MSRKAFFVQVELDIQAVTCPGVWLCTNGKVSLQIHMLDSCVQTGSYKPNFPINLNENFVFYKSFYSKHQLNELQKKLHDQWLYIELVQWQSCEAGNVLATFQTTLDELLYPTTIKGSIAGVDLDLLMEPTKLFPGTIAPKIEISTKTTIEETLCKCMKPASSTVIVNPKVLTSIRKKHSENICRKVCHSVSYSKHQPSNQSKKTKPPFCYRRAEDDLILRKPKYDLEDNYCSCRKSQSSEKQKISLRKSKPKLYPEKMCSCGSGHKENYCPVCSKYSGYFNVSPVRRFTEPTTKQEAPIKHRSNLFNENQKCLRHSNLYKCPCCRPLAISNREEVEKSESDSEIEKQFCACSKKPSLAEKLHARLTKTLSSLPKTIEWSCCNYDYECDCCECPSRAEIYRDLQKFYGDLYQRARSTRDQICIPDCPGLKSC